MSVGVAICTQIILFFVNIGFCLWGVEKTHNNWRTLFDIVVCSGSCAFLALQYIQNINLTFKSQNSNIHQQIILLAIGLTVYIALKFFIFVLLSFCFSMIDSHKLNEWGHSLLNLLVDDNESKVAPIVEESLANIQTVSDLQDIDIVPQIQ